MTNCCPDEREIDECPHHYTCEDDEHTHDRNDVEFDRDCVACGENNWPDMDYT